MKNSEITKEANSVIKDLFSGVTISDDKDVWQKALTFIGGHIAKLEATTRGESMFVWKRVQYLMLNKYGKKFITSKA